MDCASVRRRLWAAAPLRVSDVEIEEVLGHAEDCAACRVFLDQDRRVAELIRAAIPRVRAPQHLRERLHKLLAQEHADRPPQPALTVQRLPRTTRFG